MTKKEWAKSDINFKDWKDRPIEPWPDIKVTDMFYIDFDADGKSRYTPYSGVCGYGPC